MGEGVKAQRRQAIDIRPVQMDFILWSVERAIQGRSYTPEQAADILERFRAKLIARTIPARRPGTKKGKG